jgi:uncharacterized protein YutE (UPF0331/DUF86 family)
MRDIAYEQAVIRHQRRMLRILDEYSHERPDTWTERDYLAIQRALQVYIESFIGLARYYVQQKYGLSVGRSREAVDELKSRGDISANQQQNLDKIIGFRNVLVHDYLDVNESIVKAVVTGRLYAELDTVMAGWLVCLSRLPVIQEA